MITLPNVPPAAAEVAVTLPNPVFPDAWPGNLPEWGGAVVGVGDLACGEWGHWSAGEAGVLGASILAGAVAAAGTRAALPGDDGEDLILLPAAITPEWGETGFVYFPINDHIYVHVDLGSGRAPGAVWICDQLVPAEVAWAEGLAWVAASRYLASSPPAGTGQ